jgi:hypothetical protein
MVFAIETCALRRDGYSAARIEEEVVVTDKAAISLFRPKSSLISARY